MPGRKQARESFGELLPAFASSDLLFRELKNGMPLAIRRHCIGRIAKAEHRNVMIPATESMGGHDAPKNEAEEKGQERHLWCNPVEKPATRLRFERK